MGSLFYTVCVCLVCFFLAISSVGARFVVELNSLTVTSPDSIKGKYSSAIGNFGVPDYGGTLAGTIVYPKENSVACSDFGSPDKFKSPTGGLPRIVVVDRGDCYFALKVWNAQKAGAAAVLVADDRDESLITMDSPTEDAAAADYLQNITIPSALIEKSLGEMLRKAVGNNELVSGKLDWRESVPHPDERVEYEFWTNSNDQCGPKCEAQIEFVKNFKGAAQLLEKGGYTLFTPHYITWYCPEAFITSRQCKSQCINQGRYCAPDPEQDFDQGYDGKDVVLENLRELCVHKVANETLKRPWLWWDYVTDFQIRCPMSQKKYNGECAEQVITSLGLDVKKVQECMGDSEADSDNKILRGEQEAQIGQGSRGDVTMLPTLIINNVQYRGKLDRGAVMKAICSGFEEKTDPGVCLSPEMETNECLTNNGGCWQDMKANVTACKDTFRGRVCECPLVNGVQFQGDGYSSCEANGQGRCKIRNGGCWQETKDGKTFSACSDLKPTGCECPAGFKGDGVNQCEDIDECKTKTACQCPECSCKDTWGSFECECQGDNLYIRENDVCISKKAGSSKVGWVVSMIVVLGLATVAVGGYLVYKYRLRSYMDSEIRAIMAQYMPLDSQSDIHHHLHEET